MSRKKRDLEEEIHDFMDVWDKHKVAALLRDMIPFFELYHIDQEGAKELEEYEGKIYEAQVRILRTVYLLSKFAYIHAGRLCLLNAHFKDLWLRMEKEVSNSNGEQS